MGGVVFKQTSIVSSDHQPTDCCSSTQTQSSPLKLHFIWLWVAQMAWKMYSCSIIVEGDWVCMTLRRRICTSVSAVCVTAAAAAAAPQEADCMLLLKLEHCVQVCDSKTHFPLSPPISLFFFISPFDLYSLSSLAVLVSPPFLLFNFTPLLHTHTHTVPMFSTLQVFLLLFFTLVVPLLQLVFGATADQEQPQWGHPRHLYSQDGTAGEWGASTAAPLPI